MGDRIRLGSLQLEISGLIDKEPDRDFLGFSFAPRMLLTAEDLPKAKLLGRNRGSRWLHILIQAPTPAVTLFPRFVSGWSPKGKVF